MTHEEDPINVEKAWKTFQSKAKHTSANPLWADNAWAQGELHETADQKTDEKNLFRENGSERRPLEAVEDQQYKPKKRWKGIAGAAAAGLVAAGLVFGPWSGNIMAAMLHTFTVQRIQGVRVNRNELAKIQDALTKATPNGATLKFQDYGQIIKFGGGPTQQVTLQTAENKLNEQLLSFPNTAKDEVVSYEPGIRFHLKLHVKKVNELLKSLGGKVTLPVTLNGQTIQMRLPAIVQMKKPNDPKVTLAQVRVPQLDVPKNVDVQKVEKAVLSLPIIPDDIRNRIEGTTNWKKTLFVPLMNPKDHQTTVLGHQAVIYVGRNQSNQQSERILVWLQQGHIYMLRGPAGSFPTDQAIIQQAREIIRHGANH